MQERRAAHEALLGIVAVEDAVDALQVGLGVESALGQGGGLRRHLARALGRGLDAIGGARMGGGEAHLVGLVGGQSHQPRFELCMRVELLRKLDIACGS